jgi:hypothetical protein
MLQRVAVAIRQQIMAPTKSPRELLTVTQAAEFLESGHSHSLSLKIPSGRID